LQTAINALERLAYARISVKGRAPPVGDGVDQSAKRLHKFAGFVDYPIAAPGRLLRGEATFGYRGGPGVRKCPSSDAIAGKKSPLRPAVLW
jgi:hypothetical protein